MACDVYRPAAINQLHVVGDQIGVPVFRALDEKDPVKIAQAAIAKKASKRMDKIEMIASGVAMGNMRSEMIEGSEYL